MRAARAASAFAKGRAGGKRGEEARAAIADGAPCSFGSSSARRFATASHPSGVPKSPERATHAPGPTAVSVAAAFSHAALREERRPPVSPVRCVGDLESACRMREETGRKRAGRESRRRLWPRS